MTEKSRVLRLSVSPALFRLATECVQVRSNETFRLESLERLAADRLAADPSISPADADHLRDHLTAMPSAGSIALELSLAPHERLALAGYMKRLEDALGWPASEADALSALLFTFLVDHRVRVAAAAIAGGAAGRAGETGTPGPNVVPLRR